MLQIYGTDLKTTAIELHDWQQVNTTFCEPLLKYSNISVNVRIL